MLAVYLVTLNPWLTLLNLNHVAPVAGWTWQPEERNPSLFLVTLPFRLIPAGKVPLLLNLFSALCSSITLGLLARCVSILPHDRLETERQRERSDFSFLTGPLAIFPPVMAVVLVGLQLTFWEHATSFTGNSFDLLLFAGVIWQLLEYRLDELPWRLYLASLVYGAGIAEDWAFVAYFPLFITAIIWLRKLDFFIPQFLVRMLLSGIAGVLFLFLLPTGILLSGKYSISFFEALRPAVGMDWYIIRSLAGGMIWHLLGLVSLASLLPLLVMSVRWSSSFGDSSGAGKALVNYLFYIGHAGFFVICLWVMFDPPFSPKALTLGGAPGLTLYYISGLCLGYFSGFAFVAFGKQPERSRRSPQPPEPIFPHALMWLCPLIVGATLALAAVATALLIYKNAPIIRQMNDDTILKYARFVTQNLPPKGAILLGDSDLASLLPVNVYIIQAMLAREGKAAEYPVVETIAARDSVYQNYLHHRYPGVWPQIFKDHEKRPMALSEIGLVQFLNSLARSNTICYLNPSFGYYFESFYQEPHGLIYQMKFLPPETLLPPPPDASLIRENNQFWSELTAEVTPAIEKALAPPDPDRTMNVADRLLQRLHVTPEPNPNAVFAGTLYSRGLDYWGVQLQRAGELDQAATNFVAAQRLNPDNLNAGINLDFNHDLRRGNIPAIDLSKVAPDQFGKSHNWRELISANGPFDEISFNYAEGVILSDRSHLLRQAIAPFTRVRQLAPNRFDVRQRLAQAYLLNHLPDRALEALHDPITEPDRFAMTETDFAGLNTLLAAVYFEKKDYARGITVLENAIDRHPDDQTLIEATVQACVARGFYTNALTLINRQIKQFPDEPKWIFARGFTELKSGHYDSAIASFTRVLSIATNNPTPRFNRALAYLDSGRLNEAREDYLQLQGAYTNSVQIAFGLGEIAWRQHDSPEAVRNYEIYLASANTNTAEATNVIARLRELQK
jgi:tetratricopeptide (TPR) repeat protein